STINHAGRPENKSCLALAVPVWVSLAVSLDAISRPISRSPSLSTQSLPQSRRPWDVAFVYPSNFAAAYLPYYQLNKDSCSKDLGGATSDGLKMEVALDYEADDEK
ncbi:unnamed protein product, partial [Linum tenue]